MSSFISNYHQHQEGSCPSAKESPMIFSTQLKHAIMIHPLCIPFLELWELRDALLLSHDYHDGLVLFRLAQDLLQEYKAHLMSPSLLDNMSLVSGGFASPASSLLKTVPAPSTECEQTNTIIRFMYASILLFVRQMNDEITRLKELYEQTANHLDLMERESQYRNLAKFQIKFTETPFKPDVSCCYYVIGRNAQKTDPTSGKMMVTPHKQKQDRLSVSTPTSQHRQHYNVGPEITPPRTPVDIVTARYFSELTPLAFHDDNFTDFSSRAGSPSLVSPIVQDWHSQEHDETSVMSADIVNHHDVEMSHSCPEPGDAEAAIEEDCTSTADETHKILETVSPVKIVGSPLDFDFQPMISGQSSSITDALAPGIFADDTQKLFYQRKVSPARASLYEDDGDNSSDGHDSDDSEYTPSHSRTFLLQHHQAKSGQGRSMKSGKSRRSKTPWSSSSSSHSKKRYRPHQLIISSDSAADSIDCLDTPTSVSSNGKVSKNKKKEKQVKLNRTNYSSEVVTVLKAWLFRNRDHPYPSQDVKDRLAQQTGLNIIQINNWFINGKLNFCFNRG